MTKAVWNGTVLAESNWCIVVEGNNYFPPASIKRDYLAPSQTHTACAWKGLASYYDVTVDGRTNHDAAWYYSAPQEAAHEIKDYVAFWKGVQVVR
jgi:uncharacterized protein (DUF427 family)